MLFLYVWRDGMWRNVGISDNKQEGKSLLRGFKRFSTPTAIREFTHEEHVVFALAEIAREVFSTWWWDWPKLRQLPSKTIRRG